MATLVAGLVVFFAIHSFSMFRGARERVIGRLGALPYRGVFSLIAIAGFILIVTGYGDAPRVELWSPPTALRMIAMILMLPALVLLATMYLPGHIKARTRNPMLLALKTWALAHLLANGDLASVLLFGSFLTWAVIDLIAVKRSGRSSVVATPRPVFDVLAVVIGSGLWVMIVFWAHVHIAGVPLVAP